MPRPKGSKNKPKLAPMELVKRGPTTSIIYESKPASLGDTRRSSGNTYYQHIHRVKLGPPDSFVFYVTKGGVEYKSIPFDDIHVCHNLLLEFLSYES